MLNTNEEFQLTAASLLLATFFLAFIFKLTTYLLVFVNYIYVRYTACIMQIQGYHTLTNTVFLFCKFKENNYTWEYKI